MPSQKTVIAFDLYGTLLSPASIADAVADCYSLDQDQAASLAALWRRYQLEYTWRINTMGKYRPFDEITRSALGHALAEHGMTLQAADAEKLMRSYDALHVFDDIPAALELLQRNEETVEPYIFSNGTDDMVGNSIKTSPELGPHADRFKALIAVDSLGCYKPDPRTYSHLVETTGKTNHPEDVWVVSGNPFDIVGAKTAGLHVAFIDRAGKGWVDRLNEDIAPSIIARGVGEAITSILKF
ncbi:haloacid dehalogenase [Xylariaceae sp. FL0016]|nr:haloacid dehalogenase [Xylariaceae sp. FL0016]